MAKLLVIFNHTLTADQEADAHRSLGVTEIVHPPPALSNLWANIPPEPECIDGLLEPLLGRLEENGTVEDYVLIQGEFGATCLLVRHVDGLGMIPVYSTTSRKAFEEVLDNNEVRVSHRFRHVRFRRYEV